MTKVQLYVMLVLHNVEPSNVRKKKKPPNVTKVLSNVILVLPNVIMEPSNMRKNKGTTKCDKIKITCDVITTQCEDGISNMRKKKKESLNVTKVLS